MNDRHHQDGEEDILRNPNGKDKEDCGLELTSQVCDFQPVVESDFKRIEIRLARIDDQYSELTQKVQENITRLDHQVFQLSKMINTTENLDAKHLLRNRGPEELKTSLPQASHLTEMYNTLPSVRLITNSDPALHKLLWIIVHIVAFLISYAYIQEAYDNWQSSPIVQSLVMTKVKDIPFPAITICVPWTLKRDYDQFEVLKRCISKENNESQKFGNWVCSEQELKMFTVSSYIRQMNFNNHTPEWSFYKESYRNVTQYVTEWKGIDISQYISRLVKEGNDVSKIIVDGTWNFPILNSSMHGRLVHTQIEIMKCETVNGMSHRFTGEKTEGALVSGPMYVSKQSSTCTPEHILDHVCKADLYYPGPPHYQVYLTPKDIEADTFYVNIHNPFDYPMSNNIRDGWFTFSPREYAQVTITPKFTNARKDLKVVDVAKRNCLFSFEKKLPLFEFYTQKNCFVDCKINCSLVSCGCVIMALANFNMSSKICSWRKSIECQSVIGYSYWINAEVFSCYCDCPPDCVSLTYDIKASVKEPSLSIWKGDLGVSYKDHEFLSTYRYSVTSPAEFLAYSLGILGVFNGFSLILIWQLLYWLTLRLWHNIKRYPHF